MAEETKFASLQAESWKLLLEGTRRIMVVVKNGPNQPLDPTPILMTNNGLPWDTCTQIDDKKHSKNRCKIFYCKKAPWLVKYARKGKVDPRAWLNFDK